MKQKLLLTTYSLIFICLLPIYAQQTVVSSGGNATGSGGSASYSVGQIVYTTVSTANHSLAQGVQQAFEISTTLGVEDELINLSFNAYPNPTTDKLNLKIANFNQKNMVYALFDVQGRLISKQKIETENTQIGTDNLKAAIYFLKVFNRNNVIKVFKIIKN